MLRKQKKREKKEKTKRETYFYSWHPTKYSFINFFLILKKKEALAKMQRKNEGSFWGSSLGIFEGVIFLTICHFTLHADFGLICEWDVTVPQSIKRRLL